MSKRDSKLLLADIMESVEKIKKYTMGVDYEIVWTIVKKDIDKLSADIESISQSI